jgi:DNA-binding LytR/AlgR family response regulator
MAFKYKCLIAEDSLIDRDAIEMLLSKIERIAIESICSNGLEAATALQQKEIDIVFSDIDMPNLSGIELVNSLQKAPVFIFISSYAEYAAESYNLDVIDFIVKPVTLPRLIKATNKAIEYIELKKNYATPMVLTVPDTAEPAAAPSPGNDHFYIKENAGYTRIDYANLLYIESMGNFSRLYTNGQKNHITLVSLKNIEQQLPAAHFTRVHKQYIINLQHIQSLSSDGEVQLTGGHSIPSGAMYKAVLLDMINNKVLLR